MKLCNKCKVEKPLTEYYKRTYSSGNVGYQNNCKKCQGKQRVQYWKPHQVARRKFGLSDEEYTTLIERSQGLCEVCNNPMGNKRCIDHDHNTGEIRGVLCNNCNTALGLVGDNVTTLTKLIQYLER